MNRKVQKRQARVRHARREEILQAGRQWSMEPEAELKGVETRPAPEGAGETPAGRRERDLR